MKPPATTASSAISYRAKPSYVAIKSPNFPPRPKVILYYLIIDPSSPNDAEQKPTIFTQAAAPIEFDIIGWMIVFCEFLYGLNNHCRHTLCRRYTLGDAMHRKS